MGGVVNPIIGLVTIWFLVSTLKQSELSHDQQITLNEEIRDFDQCVRLISYYQESAREIMRMAESHANHFESAAKNALKTLDDTEPDNEILRKISDRKQKVYQSVAEDKEKAKQLYELANELIPILEDAHKNLKKKYLR